jgi:hypothetical protein
MHRKVTFYFLFAGLALMIAAGIFLVSVTPVSAQCGSQASSCKNCHEVQGQDSVNADGTGWHQSHAFGDFCYICHGGNQQATDKAAAHTGMVDPLSDINAACQQCHVADLQERAQVYADTLGVEIGTGSTTVSTPAPTVAAGETSTPVTAPAVDYNDPNLVNYAQQYDETVLGKYPTNWGNIILILMIIMLAVGGGYLVLSREKLINVSFADPQSVAAKDKYPADVMELLPEIAKLSKADRKVLRQALSTPSGIKEMLAMVAILINKNDSSSK